jgi:predicted phage replisome organizer
VNNKKYYWLKLKDDFFRQKEIKKLRKIAGGDTYTIIYLKMLLLAIKSGNKIYFEGVEEVFADELALELDEDSDNVKMTLAFLKNQKLIETISEDEYFLPQCESLVGSETKWAEKKRRQRKDNVPQSEDNVPLVSTNVHLLSDQCPIRDRDRYIEIEKEKDIYIDKEIEKSNYVGKYENNLKEMSKLYEQNVGLINGITSEYLIEISQKIDEKLFKRAIEIATDRGKCSLGYIKGIIKQWLDNNISSLDELNAYKLNQSGERENVGRRKTDDKAEGTEINRECEEKRRAELRRQIAELDKIQM